MKLRIMAAVFCAACLGFSSAGLAASGYGAGPQFQQGPEEQNLGMQIYNQQVPQLTPEQYDLASRLYQKSAQDAAAVRQALAAKTGLLERELAKPAPDKAAIQSLSAEIGALRGQLLAAGAELRANLAGNGLPPDCLGPCYSEDGYRHYGWGMGPGAYWGGRGWRHGGHGWRGGCWNGMMGNCW